MWLVWIVQVDAKSVDFFVFPQGTSTCTTYLDVSTNLCPRTHLFNNTLRSTENSISSKSHHLWYFTEQTNTSVFRVKQKSYLQTPVLEAAMERLFKLPVRPGPCCNNDNKIQVVLTCKTNHANTFEFSWDPTIHLSAYPARKINVGNPPLPASP